MLPAHPPGGEQGQVWQRFRGNLVQPQLSWQGEPRELWHIEQPIDQCFAIFVRNGQGTITPQYLGPPKGSEVPKCCHCVFKKDKSSRNQQSGIDQRTGLSVAVQPSNHLPVGLAVIGNNIHTQFPRCLIVPFEGRSTFPMSINKLQSRGLAERWHDLQSQIGSQVESLDRTGFSGQSLPLHSVWSNPHKLRDNPPVLFVLNFVQPVSTQFQRLEFSPLTI